jgi:hypothetical protein
MSDAFWLHFYGIVTVLSLLFALSPIIRPKLGAWSSTRKAKKKSDLEDELLAFKIYLQDEKPFLRWYRALFARGFSWMSAGIAIGIWGLANHFNNSEAYRVLVFSVTAMCLGSSLGTFLVITSRAYRFMNPEETIAKLEERIRRLT